MENGYTVGYTYDKSSRMETVSYAGQSVIYTYDKNGNRESVTYSSGIKEQFRYDRENKLLVLINSKPDGSILSSFTYTYDLTGKQITKQDSYGITTYTYDADGRIMKEETPGKTDVYSYDKAGNRISMNETYKSEQPTDFVDAASKKEIKYILKKAEYIYSSSNRLMKLVEKHCDAQGKVLLTKNTVYIYDDNGNQLRQSTSYTSNSSIESRQSIKGSSYGDSLSGAIDSLINRTSNTFNGFNRLVRSEQIQSGVRTLVDYTYNGDDLRVVKTVRKSDNSYAPETTVFLYDRQHVILETDAAGSMSVRYARGINYLARLGTSGSNSVLLYNGHGDVVQATDENGNIQNSYDYDIWGNPTLTIEQYSCSIRYAGEFFDKETGLYYLRARYYNPYIGRFISEDSFWGEDENPLSLNLYTYCKNDPIQYIDSDGHFWMFVGAAVGALISAGIEAGTQLASGKSLKELDWKSIGGAAVSGAIVGFAASATGGASLAVTMAVGASASMAGNAAQQYITKGKIDNSEVALSGAVGGLTFGMGNAITSYVTSKSTPVLAKVAKEAENVYNSVANKAAKEAKNVYSSATSKTVKEVSKTPKSVADGLKKESKIKDLPQETNAGKAQNKAKPAQLDSKSTKSAVKDSSAEGSNKASVKKSEQKVQVNKQEKTASKQDVVKSNSSTRASKSQVVINRENGKAFEKKVKSDMQKNHENVVEQLYVKTNGNNTRMILDVVGTKKNTGQLNIIEAKASQTAPLTKGQLKGQPDMAQKGATVIGKGKGPYVKGTQIPPTKVKVVRKK